MAKQRKAIVVGTGAGGLSAAAYLARDGFEVIALDRADRVGGFLAPFSVDGYSFDPGVHYIGKAGRGQALDRMLGPLGIDVERLFVEMDPDGFDAYRFPDFEVRMCRGLERYRDRLAECFPGEREGMHRLFDLVARSRELTDQWPWPYSQTPHVSDLRMVKHLPTVARWMSSSFRELLEHLLGDPRARAVVAAPDGDAGLPPSRLSALSGVGVIDYYIDGAFFPRGGSGALRDALVKSATKNGAQFRTSSEVVEILVRNSAVSGVRLASGEQLDGDVVVSDADPTITYGRLLSKTVVPRRLLRKVERTRPSIATFTIYLGMQRDLRKRGLGAFNVWHYPSWDIESVYAPVLEGRMPDELALLISSSTSRDDSGKLAPVGCSTLEVVTFIPWQPFAKWESVRPWERGADYRELRQRIADRVLAQVERALPGLVGDVAVQRISTPLDNTDHAAAVEGAAYGPAHTADQMGPWRFGTRTPIEGLLLAGAGVLSCGIQSCLTSGRIAAEMAASRHPRLVPKLSARMREIAGTAFKV